MLVVTNDLYLRRPGVLHPADQEVVRRGRVISGAEMLAMADRGELDKGDVKKIKRPAPNPEDGLISLKPGEVSTLGKIATETYEDFATQARRLVTKKRAEIIRELRCTKHYSWRLVAQTCYQSWLGADWSPPANQIMGTALCEQAARVLGEDPHQEPWNDC